MPTATIAIPTRGERTSLVTTVRCAVEEASAASIEVEVLVVWSGRTEPSDLATGLPQTVRHVFAARPGVAAARNVALREAHGALVLFLDDDIVCRPGWLESIHNCWKSGARIVGSQVVLAWPGERPSWATPLVASMFGDFDLGDSPVELGDHEALVSAGMAVDRAVALQLGGFNEGLGHGAGTSLMGEETEFCMRAMKAGLRLRYDPGAVVEHHVQPEEVSRRRFLSRMYRFGRTMTLLRPPTNLPFPILRRIGKAALFAVAAPFIGGPMVRLGDAAYLLGEASAISSSRRGVVAQV